MNVDVEAIHPASVGTVGGLDGPPTQPGAGGAAHGDRPPALLSPAVPPPLVNGDGSGSQFQPAAVLTQRPLGLSRKWCDPCEKMRDHLHGRCAMNGFHRG